MHQVVQPAESCLPARGQQKPGERPRNEPCFVSSPQFHFKLILLILVLRCLFVTHLDAFSESQHEFNIPVG